jgi:IS1 family transposase
VATDTPNAFARSWCRIEAKRASVAFLKFMYAVLLTVDRAHVYHTAYNVKHEKSDEPHPLACRTQIINCLVEGSSIRSTERMRNLQCHRLQVDEIWSYVKVKQANIAKGTDRTRIGDQWTFVAIDPDTKLVPAYLVGKRTRDNAVAFMGDISERLANRVPISSDALRSYVDALRFYVDAVEREFGADVDYGQVVKFYDAEPIGPGRYAPPRVSGQEKIVIAGNPDQRHISTSLIERRNLTMRMSMRRFTRLTNAFSKKLENLQAAVALHFAHYNLVRLHNTLRVTPAMAANVTDRVSSLEELVERTCT